MGRIIDARAIGVKPDLRDAVLAGIDAWSQQTGVHLHAGMRTELAAHITAKVKHAAAAFLAGTKAPPTQPAWWEKD